ncbi:unnamed protein product [Arabis nemorensis]|uniref:Uncharacterized protein n=1 Tax=Arabis nemorensis TaxID=586526 RepID=A0A565BRI7_9BRAS|nr:unnamed protein product [Arabis nemorensis]
MVKATVDIRSQLVGLVNTIAGRNMEDMNSLKSSVAGGLQSHKKMYVVESKAGAIGCMILSLCCLGNWPAILTLLERK